MSANQQEVLFAVITLLSVVFSFIVIGAFLLGGRVSARLEYRWFHKQLRVRQIIRWSHKDDAWVWKESGDRFE